MARDAKSVRSIANSWAEGHLPERLSPSGECRCASGAQQAPGVGDLSGVPVAGSARGCVGTLAAGPAGATVCGGSRFPLSLDEL